MAATPTAGTKRTRPRDGGTVDQMVRMLADDIVTGRLTPGTKLDEVRIAARFAVSRTPVREALQKLAAMGLVDRQPNRGAVVATMTGTYLASMFEAMAELEGICARLSAERMTVAERRGLEDAHRASARLVQLGAVEDYAAHNVTFHSLLYDGAHSPHLRELAAQTRSRLAPFRRAQFRLDGRLSRSWAEHDAIVTAIMRGDGPGAEQAVRRHVLAVSDESSAQIRDVMRQGGAAGSARRAETMS